MVESVRVSLASWLLEQIDADEMWAHEASRRDADYAEGGARWQWVYSAGDVVAEINPSHDEYLSSEEHGWKVSLRSVQEFPTRSVGPLPQFAVPYAEEVPTTVAGHIARWDPARVLAECAARRKIVALHSPHQDDVYDYVTCGTCGVGVEGWRVAAERAEAAEEQRPVDEFWSYPCRTLRLLAAPYASEPGYRAEWAI